MKLVYDWVVVDESIEDGTVIFNKIILLNSEKINKSYAKHLTRKTDKDVMLDSCFFVGVDGKAEHYQGVLKYMQQNNLYYMIIGDRE